MLVVCGSSQAGSVRSSQADSVQSLQADGILLYQGSKNQLSPVRLGQVVSSSTTVATSPILDIIYT